MTALNTRPYKFVSDVRQSRSNRNVLPPFGVPAARLRPFRRPAARRTRTPLPQRRSTRCPQSSVGPDPQKCCVWAHLLRCVVFRSLSSKLLIRQTWWADLRRIFDFPALLMTMRRSLWKLKARWLVRRRFIFSSRFDSTRGVSIAGGDSNGSKPTSG